MRRAVGIGVAVLVVPTVLLMSGAVLVITASTLGPTGRPTLVATSDIPPELLAVYHEAASTTCAMPWSVLAAIGKTESDHGRSTLPGVHSGANEAGAMGPMQFMPATWQAMGVDGDHDGVADVYNPVDAIWSAANYLCHEGAGDPARLSDALLHYSGDPRYVETCLAIAASYASTAHQIGAALVGGDYALPIERSWFDENPLLLRQPHHCCMPAIDIGVPVGTPTFAVTSGVVVRIDQPGGCGWGYQLDGDDGSTYVYCHLSDVILPSNTPVHAGDQLGSTGGAQGAVGAGNSSGPHLHFGIRRGGVDYCPQPVLQGWFDGQAINPADVATTLGCTR